MKAQSAYNLTTKPLRTLQLLLVIVLFFTQLHASALRPAKAIVGPLTVGGLIALSQIALNKIDSIAQNAIASAGDQVRQSIDSLRGNLQALIQSLSQTYQDNLNLTIDSLDAVTSNKLIQIQSMIDQVNQKLQDDINLVAAQTKSVLNQAATQVTQLVADVQQRINSLVVVTSEAVVFVVDRTLFNVILVVALIFLGLGLLLFIYLLFSRKLPSGIMRYVSLLLMILYLIVFGALALVPSIRARAMSAANLGFEKELRRVTEAIPEVVGADPATVIVGQTTTVRLIGVSLRPDNKAVTAKIGSILVPVVASAREAVLTVTGINLVNGAQEAILLYDGAESARTRVILTIQRPVTQAPPADLTITNFTISPLSPVQRGNATATIRVLNQGGTTATNFALQWKPFAAHPGLTQVVASLAPGAAQTFTFDHSYINSGLVDSIATVDVNNAVSESNEGNNGARINSINVQPAPPRRFNVQVRFTQIAIHSDADPFAAGELFLNFSVGGQNARFPTSGTRDMNDGDTISLTQTFNLTLNENDTLAIFVNGTDEDSPGFPAFDDNDPMGTVSRSFLGAANFGAGSYAIRSTCPDGCYTISFTITATPIN